MKEKSGILHVYSISSIREGLHIVGDQEGLFALWLAIGEALISEQGQGEAEVQTSLEARYSIPILRVDRESNFLKQFPPTYS